MRFQLLVRVPGWKVDDKCVKSSNGKSLRCVNYADDAHIASNVGCVAQCEAEYKKVKSFEQAQKLDDIAQVCVEYNCCLINMCGI